MYTGSAFFCAISGGCLADRLAVVLGMLLRMAGWVALGVGQPLALALGLLVAGPSLFKPKTADMAGAQYLPDEARCQGRYMAFYMGVNIGTALSALIGGYLARRHGRGYGYMAAAVGMAIGIVVLMASRRFERVVAAPARPTWTDARAPRRIRAC